MSAHEKDDHAMFEVVKNSKAIGGHSPRVTTPSQVLYVPDKSELMSLLQLYAHPFIRHVVPDSQFARRWHVEKVRPALRYYCKKFGVEVPEWLKNEDAYRNLSNEEKQDLFGTTTLKRKEFRPVNYDHGMTRGPGQQEPAK